MRNLRIVQHDAVELLRDSIAPESLDAILVLFPDPWHKKRHHKRRLVSRAFAELARIAPEAGRHPAAGDRLDALRRMDAGGARGRARACATAQPDGGYMPRDPGRSATRFEQRGERLGHAVHDLCYRTDQSYD